MHRPVQTRNSLPWNSSTSFKTKSHWCFNWRESSDSEQFLQIQVNVLNFRPICYPSKIPDWQREDKNFSSDRQTVFVTAVNPTHENHQNTTEPNLIKPLLASDKQKWKMIKILCTLLIHNFLQKKLPFHQTKWNSTFFFFFQNTPNLIVVLCGSPHTTPTIFCKYNWTWNFFILMLQEAIKTSNQSNQNQKPND